MRRSALLLCLMLTTTAVSAAAALQLDALKKGDTAHGFRAKNQPADGDGDNQNRCQREQCIVGQGCA